MMPIVPMTDEFSPTLRRDWKLPNGIQLIGISGHARTGKDEVAAMLARTYTDTYGEKFADPLKAACSAAFGIPLSQFNRGEEKEIIDPFWGVSPRMTAQFVGSEMFRDTMGMLMPSDRKDFWVRKMWGLLSGARRGEYDGNYEFGDTVVIGDVRFQNEVDFITANNGVHIHLVRPEAEGKVGLQFHQSESQNFSLKGDRTYVVQNDSTLDSLFERVQKLVSETLTLTPYDVSNNI